MLTQEGECPLYFIGETAFDLPDIQSEAISRFTLTNNPLNALYILSDGQMLSLGEAKSHRDIRELYRKGTSDVKAILDFEKSGAVRFARRSATGGREFSYCEFVGVPSRAQICTILKATCRVPKLVMTLINSDGKAILDSCGEHVKFNGEFPLALDILNFMVRVRAESSRTASV